jgi:hypothetical protein
MSDKTEREALRDLGYIETYLKSCNMRAMVDMVGNIRAALLAQPEQAPLPVQISDEQLHNMIVEACHSDPVMVSGEYCLSMEEVRALLAIQAQPQTQKSCHVAVNLAGLSPDLEAGSASEGKQ